MERNLMQQPYARNLLWWNIYAQTLLDIARHRRKNDEYRDRAQQMTTRQPEEKRKR
jgi:hypothetical protein